MMVACGPLLTFGRIEPSITRRPGTPSRAPANRCASPSPGCPTHAGRLRRSGRRGPTRRRPGPRIRRRQRFDDRVDGGVDISHRRRLDVKALSVPGQGAGLLGRHLDDTDRGRRLRHSGMNRPEIVCVATDLGSICRVRHGRQDGRRRGHDCPRPVAHEHLAVFVERQRRRDDAGTSEQFGSAQGPAAYDDLARPELFPVSRRTPTTRPFSTISPATEVLLRTRSGRPRSSARTDTHRQPSTASRSGGSTARASLRCRATAPPTPIATSSKARTSGDT